MSDWHITTLDEEARQELLQFMANEDIKHEVRRILKMLASQRDPRQPAKSSSLIVNPIEYDAPGWFRVKVPRYALRIIFRLMVVRDDQAIELKPDEIPDEQIERFIDITRVGRHPDVYGKALRERYKKLGGHN